MRKEFVMRGQTASGLTEVLNFGKYKQGYAYKLVDFKIYPSTNLGGVAYELAATVLGVSDRTISIDVITLKNNENSFGTKVVVVGVSTNHVARY